jgi:hypothetical protein
MECSWSNQTDETALYLVDHHRDGSSDSQWSGPKSGPVKCSNNGRLLVRITMPGGRHQFEFVGKEPFLLWVVAALLFANTFSFLSLDFAGKYFLPKASVSLHACEALTWNKVQYHAPVCLLVREPFNRHPIYSPGDAGCRIHDISQAGSVDSKVTIDWDYRVRPK